MGNQQVKIDPKGKEMKTKTLSKLVIWCFRGDEEQQAHAW